MNVLNNQFPPLSEIGCLVADNISISLTAAAAMTSI